jgi:replicative DNA helicase
MDLAFDRIEARSQRDTQLSGIPTGFLDLDRILAGFQDSELVVIAARPGVGKTALGLALTHHVALKEKLPVFFVSLEQSAVELADRILSSEGNVDGQRIRLGRLSAEDGQSIVSARDRLRQAKVFIDDAPAQSMLRIAASARRLRLKHGIRLIVVDYLQLITPDNRKEPRQEQVAGISRRLKQLAREIKVPVVALAQLNRGVEDRQGQRPRLSDLRESGAIEADADTVLLLHRSEVPNQIEVLVAKQRNGPTGGSDVVFRAAVPTFRQRRRRVADLKEARTMSKSERRLLKQIALIAEKAYRRGFQQGHLAATGGLGADAPTAAQVYRWRFAHHRKTHAVCPPGSRYAGQKDGLIERLGYETDDGHDLIQDLIARFEEGAEEKER